MPQRAAPASPGPADALLALPAFPPTCRAPPWRRMEAKLRSMESRLQLGASAVAELQHAEQDPDGTVNFHFGDSLPSAAELQKSVAVNGSNLAKK